MLAADLENQEENTRFFCKLHTGLRKKTMPWKKDVVRARIQWKYTKCHKTVHFNMVRMVTFLCILSQSFLFLIN